MSKTQIRYGSDVVCYTQSPKMVSKTERYRFVSWDPEGLLTDNPMTLEHVTETHEYTPIFSHEWQCNFISPFGMVYANGTAADKPLWLRDQETVHLKAVADANYAFEAWSDGYEEDERDVTIDQAMFLQATFVEVKEINISYPEGFIVTYPAQIKKGDTLQIVISEEEGNLLYYKGLVDSDGNAYETTDITIHDVQKNMNFEMIWANPVLVALDGENCQLSGMGNYKAYSDVDIVCTPDEGYKFTQWSDGDTHASRTIHLEEEDIHLVATCEEDLFPTLTVNNSMEDRESLTFGRCDAYQLIPATTTQYNPGDVVHCVMMFKHIRNAGTIVRTAKYTISVDGEVVATKSMSAGGMGTLEWDITMDKSHTVTFETTAGFTTISAGGWVINDGCTYEGKPVYVNLCEEPSDSNFCKWFAEGEAISSSTTFKGKVETAGLPGGMCQILVDGTVVNSRRLDNNTTYNIMLSWQTTMGNQDIHVSQTFEGSLVP